MNEIFDYVAVGVGPANLSLAALAEGRGDVRGVHLEQNSSFSWHPGLLLPDATLQVSSLKDLVTPIDPTSRYSFQAFLVASGRFYDFITARFPAVHRAEYAQYLTWVADQLPTVHLGQRVEEVAFSGDCFTVKTQHRNWRGRHLVVGTGQRPVVPAPFVGHLGPEVFHSSSFLDHEPGDDVRRVVVVGGGQSGAEVVRHLMRRAPRLEIDWVSRRPGVLPLDDSAFTNDLFLPEAALAFFGHRSDRRAELLAAGKYASDGVDARLITEIYQAAYLSRYVDTGRPSLKVHPGYEAVRYQGTSSGHGLELFGNGGPLQLTADAVVLATGYSQSLPPCLDAVRELIPASGGVPAIRQDFSVDWDGPPVHRIYVQNGARHAFGIADPNLSLVAWRSNTILDSITADRSPAHDGTMVASHAGGVPRA